MSRPRTVKTTCPYCGVGCGLLVTVGAGGSGSVTPDPEHPANLGLICSKGAALAETIDLEGRLLEPMIDGETVSWERALDHVAGGLRAVIEQHGPEAVAFYLSGQLLTEDYYVANKLMKGFIGSANIDGNSRLCMASAGCGHERAFGCDAVPASYEDMEQAQLVVLVGSNLAWCHPVLYQRLARAKRARPDLAVVVIDPRHTATVDIADMHLMLHPGSDAYLFNGLLSYLAGYDATDASYVERHTEGYAKALAAARDTAPDLASVSRHCQLPREQVQDFYALFTRTARTVTLFSQGVNQSARGTDKVNAIINCHLATGRIGRPGMGPCSLTGQPNAMGGREVGASADHLAAHMAIDDARHRDIVRRFWRAPRLVEKRGLQAVELFQALHEGKIKAVWIMGTNPAVTLPEADRVRDALRRCELVVVSDCVRNTDTGAAARVLLPALAWGEKDGTVTNSERRISRQRAFLPAPGNAKADWWIMAQVARRLGHAKQFGYRSSSDVFREHAALSAIENEGTREFDIGALAGLSKTAYDRLQPVQWPLDAQGAGTARLFADGRYRTPSGKAQFVAVSAQAPAQQPGLDFPLLLNTGRVRDQWHTMARSGKSPRLSQHRPEPYVQVHGEDAQCYGVRDGDLVRVSNARGAVVVRAQLSDEVSPGQIFVPIHWNDRYSARARVGALIASVTDPVSGQPESKHTPAALAAWHPAWSGQILSRRSLEWPDCDYWAASRAAFGFRYFVAGAQPIADWAAWAGVRLGRSQSLGDEWIDAVDRAQQGYRCAYLRRGLLESYLEIGPDVKDNMFAFVSTLFAKPRLSMEDRRRLRSGGAQGGPGISGEKMLCACLGVSEKTICAAIAAGADTVEAVGRHCQAGTNCGSCLPEIHELLRRRASA